ncbi:hypothetical protein DSM104443_02335 [Usitatibacter rugosus]|uniref:HD domain-containing protein n=1 Tax=Usitatibacter rugosus TaxID=2732067 RepID=A0A6M4GW64_9PROT|nr:hypothetical protein [Usitatibacter rugosus]QJR11262.1 hypothetical protein DSM104443_02335 [Usitatibacter rugosus]
MDTLEAKRPTAAATRLLAGVPVPDTKLVNAALAYARENSQPYLFNHGVRSWLFAVLIAEARKTPHDAEVLAVTTLLHDIGLEEAFAGPLRFEVEGANAVRAFARNEGMDERRAQLVWDGVALNSTPSIAFYKEAEVALATAGIGLDWGGIGYEALPEARIEAIVEAFPRLEMKKRFAHAICGLARSRAGTTYDNFAREFGERFVPGYKAPSTVDFFLNSPFRE